MTARTAPRGAAKPADARTALIRAIMAACKSQGIDSETRQAVQFRVIEKPSMRDMTVAELRKLRDHFNRGSHAPRGQRAVAGKIKALWWSLYWIGATASPNEDALNAFIKRQTHIQHINFLDHVKAASVIEALKSWLEREGVMWWSAEQVDGVARTAGNTFAGSPFTQAEADRHAVLSLLGDRLDGAGLVAKFAMYDWIGTAVGRPTKNQWSFSAAELDEGIRLLGKKYRAHLAKEQRL